jgi:hypothetical protein
MEHPDYLEEGSRPLSLYEVAVVKFYLDEDLRPKIAEILRKSGIDALSAHEVGMCGASDQRQLDFGATYAWRDVAQNHHT